MSSNTGYIMTLANSIIGVGILAMPFCFQKCGILLSILLLVSSTLITRLACHYLLKTSIKVRRKNFEFLASYIFGTSGKLMVELCVIGYLIGNLITYFVVVGDLGPQIIARCFGINQTDSLRTFTMILVTIFCIIPLCLLKNIESLSLICISSVLFYFCLVLKICFESENKMLSTYWYDNVYWWRVSGVTQCLPIFSMALSCQMQIFEVYESLPNQTIEKMNHIVKYATGICTLVYICVGFFGYVAFYDQAFAGNVLLSLSPSLASDIICMGFVLSVAVSFPLVVFPCRASLYSLLYHRSHSETTHYIPEHRFKYITISIVLVALVIGIFIPSIELIIGLVGSTIGVAICIMFPASVFIKINKKNSTERLSAQFLLVFGFALMILGTYANLGAIDEQQSGTNVVIERLPDIHIEPTSNILEPPAKLNNENDVLIEPKKPIDSIQDDAASKLMAAKRKPVKQPENDPIREINLSEKKVEPSANYVAPIEPQKQSIVKDSLDDDNASAKLPNDAPAVNPPNVNIPNQLAEPVIEKKAVVDSTINKEAIQKEEQEIAINADENTLNKEIKELSKLNEINQELVMKKIKEISEKVDNIAQMQKNDAAQPEKSEVKDTPARSDGDVKEPAVSDTRKLNEPNVVAQEASVVNKKPVPKDPVIQLLADQKVNTQVNAPEPKIPAAAQMPAAKIDQPVGEEKKLPEPIKQPEPVMPEPVMPEPLKPDPIKPDPPKNENVGRDLLSAVSTNDHIET